MLCNNLYTCIRSPLLYARENKLKTHPQRLWKVAIPGTTLVFAGPICHNINNYVIMIDEAIKLN